MGDNNTIHGFLKLHSIDPKEDGELRMEIDEGTYVGFKRVGNEYQIAVYEGRKQWSDLTPDFDEACEMLNNALMNPEMIKNG